MHFPALVAGTSLAVLYGLFDVRVSSLAALAGGLCAFYCALRAVGRVEGSARSVGRAALTAGLLALFFFRSTVSGSGALLPRIGLAYLVLKLVSCVFEKPEELAEGGIAVFLGYSLFAPTYAAGPLYDFRYFRRRLAARLAPDERRALLLQGTRRVILGLFKTRVLAFVTSHYAFYNWPDVALARMPWWEVLGIVQLTFLDIYLNFSGYTDLAIGASACVGISVPENFDKPFLCRNLQEFWQRWHISLAEWLKTYVFYPLYRELLRVPVLRRRPEVAAGIGVLATFGAMGLWHGMRLNYAAYGLVHGAGFLVFLASRRLLGSGETMTRPARLVADVLGRAATLQFVATALLLFYADDARRWRLAALVFQRLFLMRS